MKKGSLFGDSEPFFIRKMAYKPSCNMAEMAYNTWGFMAYKSGGNMVEMSYIFLVGLLSVHIDFGFSNAVQTKVKANQTRADNYIQA